MANRLPGLLWCSGRGMVVDVTGTEMVRYTIDVPGVVATSHQVAFGRCPVCGQTVGLGLVARGLYPAPPAGQGWLCGHELPVADSGTQLTLGLEERS